MKRKIQLLTSLFILVCNGVTYSQITFQKSYGGLNGYSVALTNDSGYVIGARKAINGNSDFYVIRTNVYGDTLWTRSYGGILGEQSSYVEQTSDSGYIISGNTESFGAGDYDIYLVKTDMNGDTLWSRTYGGMGYDWGKASEIAGGGFIICGVTSCLGCPESNIFLIRTDADGDTLWTKKFDGGGDDRSRSVEQTNDGGFIIAGYSNGLGPWGYDLYLIKTDGNGNVLWSKSFGGTNDEEDFSVKQTSDGGYIIAGYSSSFNVNNNSDAYLIKTDSTGNMLWTRTYGGPDSDAALSVDLTSDGGYIMVGITSSFGSGLNDVYLIKTNGIGDTIWTRTFGGPIQDQAWSVKQTHDGGYVIAAETFGPGNSGEAYLIKTDSNGNSGCNQGNTSTITDTTATLEINHPAGSSFSNFIVTSPVTGIGSGDSLTTFCTSVGVNEIKQDVDVPFISPNPFLNEILLSIHEQKIKQVVFSVKTFFGQTVFFQEENNLDSPYTKTIDLSFLTNGMYLLELIVEGKRTVQKIIKE